MAHGLGHCALQRHRIGKCGAHRQQGQNITRAQLLLQTRAVQRQVHHLAGRLKSGIHPFQQGLAHRGHRRHTAAVGQHRIHALAADAGFVDGALVKRTQHGHAGPRLGNENHVPRQQSHVVAFIAFGDEVVEVDLREQLAIAAQLNCTHAAICTGATACEKGIDQGTQTGHRIGARLTRLTDHIHLNAAQATQAGIHIEVGDDLGQLRLNGRHQLTHGDARQ